MKPRSHVLARNTIKKRLIENEAERFRLERELETLKGPVWQSSNDYATSIPIGDMDDKHLYNAIQCMLRKDVRYTYTPNRMRSFAELISEAEERELDWRTSGAK